MVTKELQSFIQESLKQGKTIYEIRSVLKQQGGWNEQDLAEAFSPQVKTKSSGMFLKILFPVILVGLVGGGYYLYKTKIVTNYITKNTSSQDVTNEVAPVVNNNTNNNKVIETPALPKKTETSSAPKYSTNPSIKSIMSEAQVEAETYLNQQYEKYNQISYKGVCQANLKSYIDKLKAKNIQTVSCYDAVESYALSASLPTGGFICVDNSGFDGNTKANITGPKCK